MTVVELYALFLRHPRVTTDSRTCPKGSIFFALKGERFDGNEYVEKALSVGSAYAVIDNPDYYTGERTILVEDVLKTLQQLACHHRKAMGIPVIAVTGTNGKTTTKELLAAVLSSKFNLLYTEGNLNNHIGVPLTLLRLNHEHELAIIEMGANKPGDIKELAEIARPNYGIITNIGRAHLEGFGSPEGVLHTKGELYDYIRRTKGTIFIKKEDKDLQSIGKGINQITYGSSGDAFASGAVERNDPFLTFNWKQQGKLHTVETSLIGGYNLDNVLIAVSVGRFFKIPSEWINRAISAYVPDNNRSQWVKTKKNQLIVDAYNANPTSMEAAINNFAKMDLSPKAVILGDMLELGAESAALHKEIVELLKKSSFEHVILCGPLFAQVGEDFLCYPDTDHLLTALQEQPVAGYTILLKGSRGMQLEKVIPRL